MGKKREAEFGRRITELEHELSLIYPEQVRPEGVAAVCLDNSQEHRYVHLPRRRHTHVGESIWLDAEERWEGYHLYRDVCVVNEEGRKLHSESIWVASQTNPRTDELSEIGHDEWSVLQGIYDAMKMLKSYAQEKNLDIQEDITYLYGQNANPSTSPEAA